MASLALSPGDVGSAGVSSPASLGSRFALRGLTLKSKRWNTPRWPSWWRSLAVTYPCSLGGCSTMAAIDADYVALRRVLSSTWYSAPRPSWALAQCWWRSSSSVIVTVPSALAGTTVTFADDLALLGRPAK